MDLAVGRGRGPLGARTVRLAGVLGLGAVVGSNGYRSAYGVATIPIGKSSSATVAISTGSGRGPWPMVAGGPWYAGPAGPGIMSDCVCREAPDGSQLCRPARAESRIDAEMAGAACVPH